MIATPGRLIDLGDRGEVAVDELETLVLDEADRMADMGFMPQVEWVLRRLDPPHQTLLFSATLDGAVDRLVKRYLTDPVFHEVASATQTVTLMEHRFLQVHQMDKVKVAAAICRNQEKSLLFVRTKRGADRWSRTWARRGSTPRRSTVTSARPTASGRWPTSPRGSSRPGGHRCGRPRPAHRSGRRRRPLRPPEDHKAYLHRSGRTARAGRAGVVVSLSLWNQLVEIEVIQRRLGLRIPIVEMFSNDPRLAHLAAWTPPTEEGVL